MAFLLLIGGINASDLLSMTINIFDNAGNPVDGDVVIEIWDSATAGNLIYNSTDDFLGNVTNGKVDIMIGASGSSAGITPLNLTYGTNYFMNIIVNGTDLDFHGLDRQEFTAMVGNITVKRLDIDDTLFVQDLIPKDNVTYDLGSFDTRWRNIYSDAITTFNLSVSGTSYLGNIDMDGNRLTEVGELIMKGLTTSQNIIPVTTDLYSLGNRTNWFDELYVRTIHADDIHAENINVDFTNSTVLNSTDINTDIMDVEENLTVAGYEIRKEGDDLAIILN